jgi:hypothetical protein
VECRHDHARTEHTGAQHVRHTVDSIFHDRNRRGHSYHRIQHDRRGRNEQLHHERFYGSMCYDRNWHSGHQFDDISVDRNDG